MTAPTTRRFDPDALAALEEERDFLLRSLADLEAERDAGDLDEDDYRSLKDDYTRRAAEVIRAVERQHARVPGRATMRWRQGLVWLVGLALLGGVAGFLIARSSGTRGDSDAITGGVRTSVVTRLNQARALLGDPDGWDEAIGIYTSVVDEQPSNAEALTYRAWLRYRQGAPVGGVLDDLEQAGVVDPDFPDAAVFRIIVLSDAARFDEAADVLAGFDLANAPPAIAGLVQERGLVGQVFGEARYDELQSGGEASLAELGLAPDAALEAAGYLLSTDKPQRSVVALKLYRAVSAADPDSVAALSREAMLLALTGDPALVDQAEALAGRAVAVDGDDPEALMTRATVLILADRSLDVACADLQRLRQLPGLDTAVETRVDELASACP